MLVCVHPALYELRFGKVRDRAMYVCMYGKMEEYGSTG